MSLPDVRVTGLYERTINSTKSIIIHRGGAGSGKSIAVSQAIVAWFGSVPNLKILVLRKTFPSIRLSAMQEIYRRLDDFHIRHRIREEKIAFNIVYPHRDGDSVIHFGSVDDPEKLKSTEWDIIWFEEATEFSYDDFKILQLRVGRSIRTDGFMPKIILSFNPIDEYHWIKERLIDPKDEWGNPVEDFDEIVSSYRDNAFLSPTYLMHLERLAAQDMNFYRIYTLGEWGRLENLIFRNWRMKQMEETPRGEVVFGVDFGYNDPTAVMRLTLDKADLRVHIHEVLYESGLTTAQLIARMQSLIPRDERRRPFYCDNAEPDKIAELQQAGFNAMPCNKKSIQTGIDFVKRWEMVVTPESGNMVKELRAYSWKLDKAGRVTDEVVDFLNHAIDATRYGMVTHYDVAGKFQVVFA